MPCVLNMTIVHKEARSVYMQKEHTVSCSLCKTHSMVVVACTICAATRKGGISRQNVFLHYTAFRIYRFVRIFAANLELIARCVAGI